MGLPNLNWDCGMFSALTGVKNVPLGVSWIKKAALKGIPQAEHEMGSLYLMGIGVAQKQCDGCGLVQEGGDSGLCPVANGAGVCV